MCSLVSCSEGVCARVGGEEAGGGGCSYVGSVTYMHRASENCESHGLRLQENACFFAPCSPFPLCSCSLSAPVALIQPLLLDGRLSHHPDPLLSCRTRPLLQSGSTCVHRTLGRQYHVCVNGRKRCALILRWPLLNPAHVISYLYDGGIVGVGGREGWQGYSSVQ